MSEEEELENTLNSNDDEDAGDINEDVTDDAVDEEINEIVENCDVTEEVTEERKDNYVEGNNILLVTFSILFRENFS